MHLNDIVKEVAKRAKTTQAELAKAVGIKQSALTQRFRRRTLTYADCDKMLAIMNYIIVAKPRETECEFSITDIEVIENRGGRRVKGGVE